MTRAERLQREAEAASREARRLPAALDGLTQAERAVVRRAARQLARQQRWARRGHLFARFPEETGGAVLDRFAGDDVRLWARLADVAVDLARCPRRVFTVQHRAHLGAAMRALRRPASGTEKL